MQRDFAHALFLFAALLAFPIDSPLSTDRSGQWKKGGFSHKNDQVVIDKVALLQVNYN